MTSFFTDEYTIHTGAVDLIASAGAAIPAEWTALRDRFENSELNRESAIRRHTSALIAGNPKIDMTALYVAALAEAAAMPPNHAQVINHAKVQVTARLREIFADSANGVYGTIATKINDTAAAFTQCANTVDVTADAADLIEASTEIRSAYVTAEIEAQKLNQLLPVLSAAAALCGLDNADTAELQIPLIVDTHMVGRRALWTAWESTGRCGRWPEIVKLTEIRAADTPNVESYRRPLPLQEKIVPVDRWRHQRIVVDPEVELEQKTTAK